MGSSQTDRQERLGRAHGLWLGQLCGDALRSVVEFLSPDEIAERFPQGVSMGGLRRKQDTLEGQMTDDSEMACELGWALIKSGGLGFREDLVAGGYVRWTRSEPFDIGNTIGTVLAGIRETDRDIARRAREAAQQYQGAREGNGAMMRQSPFGIWGACLPVETVGSAVRKDTLLTHASEVTVTASQVYVDTLAMMVQNPLSPEEAYGVALQTADNIAAPPAVCGALSRARDEVPVLHRGHIGFVILALQNAFFQLLHAPSLAEGVKRTVALGGDTDTNAAIAGALLGGMYGNEAIPAEWLRALERCEPRLGDDAVRKPRPVRYWPPVVLCLPDLLMGAGEAVLRRVEGS